MNVSVKSRFIISLGANLVRGAVTLLITIVLARLLGSEEYGRIAFLLATFQALRQLTDPGLSSAFYTFLSQQARTKSFVAGYWGMLTFKYALTLLVVTWVLPDSWAHYIWRGEPKDLLVFAITAIFFQFDVWQSSLQMLESQRQTARAQFIFVSGLILQLVAIIALQKIGMLSIRSYLLTSATVWLVAAGFALMSYGTPPSPSHSAGDDAVFSKFLTYCLPLLPLTLVNFFSEFSDRWLLQTWAGSQEQAYFSVAQQIAAATLLITASFIRVLWKEIAEAFHVEKSSQAMLLYFRAKKVLFFLSALIAGLLGSWGPEILNLTFGPAYVDASMVLALMVNAAAFQTLGQIEGTLLLASGHTKTGVLFNFMMAPAGFFLLYVLIANSTASLEIGLGLGAVGLALKVLAMQLISVNVLGFLLCRRLQWRFEWSYQPKFLVLAGGLGIAIKSILALGTLSSSAMLLWGIPLYLSAVLGAIFIFRSFFEIDLEFPHRAKMASKRGSP